jgi:molybdenum cofactor cytidylyltransferase
MKFLTLPIDRVEGALLARPVVRSGLAFGKSRKLSAADIALLRIVGVDEVAVALVEPGDVAEDEAARRIGERLANAGLRIARIHGGRCDLAADAPGLIAFAPEQIHALNRIDESITIATLPHLERVAKGQIVATIKVNPFAVPEGVVEAWEGSAATLALRTFTPRRAGLIQTTVPELKASVLDKTSRSARQRLEQLGGVLIAERRAAHDQASVAQALAEMALTGADLILICGAYSTADRHDVVPAAIVEAGGFIACFGMPVEPGNLLLVGGLNGADVVGLPGCARALQLNGFDFVLQRLAAGLKVGREEIAAMGVGGLLRRSPPASLLAEPPDEAPGRGALRHALSAQLGAAQRQGPAG